MASATNDADANNEVHISMLNESSQKEAQYEEVTSHTKDWTPQKSKMEVFQGRMNGEVIGIGYQ